MTTKKQAFGVRNGTPNGPAMPTKRSAAKSMAHDLVDAKEAAALLGVKPQTLYAYVSRGLIRAAPGRQRKESLYHREDVELARLKGRRGTPKGPPAERLLRWDGGALLQTSITALGPTGPRYRGRLAVDLVESQCSYEDCVELLWGGMLPLRRVVWRPAPLPAAMKPFMTALTKVAPQINSRRLLAITADAYTACSSRHAELAVGAPMVAARHLIQVLAPVCGLLHEMPRYVASTREEPVAVIVARSCGVEPADEVRRALDACLVLCADHELAPSTFAARIAASAGADIFSCVNIALGAFESLLGGMGCDQAEEALLAARSPKAYVQALMAQRERKEAIPGYGHALYTSGDPRAAVLIDLARALHGRKGAARATLEAIDAATEALGLLPNLATGLVAVSAALGLPVRSPGAVMALARTAGWVAHSFEQRLSGLLVRPRARYVGPPPAARNNPPP